MLALRYGTNRPTTGVVALVAVLAVALLAFLTWATFVGSVAPVRADLLTFTMTNPEVTRIELSVRTRPGLAGPFTCVVRAQGERRVDVGYVLLDIAPTDGREDTVAYDLRTRSLARTVQVLGCFTGEQVPAGVPTPQFPPGVRAPDQAPPGRAP
jgi:hypothetical protein